MLVAFSGNLATGKSTLLQFLSEASPNIRIHLELPEENLYLRLIDTNERALLGFELQFLLACFEAYRSAQSTNGLTCIERTLEENGVFAKRTLQEPDLSLYLKYYNLLLNIINTKVSANVLLYASLDTIERNLSRRAWQNADTKRILEYPRMLNSYYEHLKLQYQGRHDCIVVDMDEYDIVESIKDKNIVVNKILNFIDCFSTIKCQ